MRYFLVLLALLVSSCAVYPVRPWTTDVELEAHGQSLEALEPHDLESSRDLVLGLSDTLRQAAADKQRFDTIVNEVYFYGTFLAVAGVAADSRGARNTGGGLAALSTIFGSHYRFADQHAALLRTAGRVDCVQEAIRPLSPIVRDWFDETFDGHPDIAQAVALVPAQTVDAVRKIGEDLDASLTAVKLSSPTQDEMTTTVSNLLDAKGKANQITPTSVNLTQVQHVLGEDVSRTEAMQERLTAAPASAQNSASARKVARHRAELSIFGTYSEQQLSDAKHAFGTAALTYGATLQTCLIQHTP